MSALPIKYNVEHHTGHVFMILTAAGVNEMVGTAVRRSLDLGEVEFILLLNGDRIVLRKNVNR